MYQHGHEPGVGGGRSSPCARGKLRSDRSGEGQLRDHIPGTATSSCEDPPTQGITDPTKRDAEVKPDGDGGGSVVGRVHHPPMRRNPSLRIRDIMNRQGGELRIALSSSNNRRTRKSLRRANRNSDCPPESGGLATGAGGHKEVGTRGSSHSINRHGESHPGGDGGGMAISRTGKTIVQ